MSFSKFLLGLTLSIIATTALGDVINEGDVFAGRPICAEYQDFLGLEGNPQDSECTETQEFISNSANLEILDFLSEYLEKANEKSSLFLLANAQRAIVRGDYSAAFMWMDVADRQVYSDLILSGDQVRASFYSSVLSDLKSLFIKEVCQNNKFNCQLIDRYFELDEIIGDIKKNVLEERSDIVLLCLLRTDAFSMPLRQLIVTPKFENCIQFNGEK
ncbi:hypothetical protein RKLH11_2103 [Rhodobacteraceae bacterium KLH11]|nr:hypothetical protein RKLH11_2103 [Rhodobacteraceae bacterium KLH11]